MYCQPVMHDAAATVEEKEKAWDDGSRKGERDSFNDDDDDESSLSLSLSLQSLEVQNVVGGAVVTNSLCSSCLSLLGMHRETHNTERGGKMHVYFLLLPSRWSPLRPEACFCAVEGREM